MSTRVEGMYVGYIRLLREVKELSNQLSTLGYGLSDLAYFGYDSEAIRNEWNYYESIKNALDELQNEVNKALGNERE